MHVKTYQGKSTGEVMARIKKDLGPDAIILNTQTKTVDGKPCCEVMAAREDEPLRAQTTPSVDPGNKEFAGWQTMQQEWAELREQCLAVLKPRMNLDQLPTKQRQVMQYLEKEGVASHCMAKIWKQMLDDPSRSPLHILSEIVTTHSWTHADTAQKIHALTGPYGSGKTSTLLRVALAMKRRNPSAKICLANADHYHGKGRLFLKHYADISGLYYRDLVSDKDWSRIVAQQNEYDTILIDLPGLDGQTTLAEWIAEECPGIAQNIAFHLVLSPLYSTAQQAAYVRKFQIADLTSIIWTKLDEACSYADIVNQSFTSGLPVSLFSFGPGLRNTIAPARQADIWRMLFKHQLPHAS